MITFFTKHWRKVTSAFLIASLITFGLFRLYYTLTDDFRLANVNDNIPNRAEWNVSELSSADQAQLDNILSQKFYYIGKGAQSYAFGSSDGKYVIKFFKFKHLRPSFWLDILPPIKLLQDYRDKQYQRKTRKLEGVFAGYRLAYEQHRSESGLIFIHLNKTSGLYRNVTVFDKMGWEHSIPIDKVVFIVQERAKTAREVIHEQLRAGHVDESIKKLDGIFDLYLSEYQKGIYDSDHGVMRNVGFVGERVIHLDVGKLKQNDAIKELDNYKKDLSLVGNRMASWLSKHEPSDFSKLKEHIENKISTITGENFVLDNHD